MPNDFTPDSGDQGSFDEFLARYLEGQRQAQGGRPIDIGRFLTTRTQELLGAATRFALGRGQAEVDALHVLATLTGNDTVAQAIRQSGGDPDAVRAAAEQRLPGAAAAIETSSTTLTPAAQRTLFHAYQVARASGSTYIDPEHLFFALVIAQDSPAGRVLAEAGVTPEALQERAERVTAGDIPAGDARGEPQSTTPMLDRFGTDLTEAAREGRLDQVIGRIDEVAQTVEILSRRRKNNPVLIGEAGVGKTAIVEGLAQAIVAGTVPEQLRGKRLISLDFPAMVAGTRYRGDFEERLTNLVAEIAEQKDELIVFIDELHTVIGAGGASEGMDAGNVLKPRLARGELHLVGATTLREYRTIEKDAAFERRFQPVTIAEPSVGDSVAILHGLKETYAEHHGIRYTDDAIRAAVELSDRYISDRFLPDKAIDLIDQAGARLRLTLGVKIDADALLARLGELEAEKNDAVEQERYEEASRIRDEIVAVQKRIDGVAQAPRPAVDAVVDEPQIAEIISRATGIPTARLTSTDRERLARLEQELHERVVGQDDAVSVVAKSVRRSRSGMGDARRPIGSFLFLGPTGVGKTELARSLAASLFGDEDAMLRFDMSEFGERHTVSRLVGAPPGYVGYDEAGQLTERVRRRPYSVVLFDEIEKAHPDLFNLLLQVLDDGRLTDGQGRTVDFRNTVVIMTSNLGSEYLASRTGAPGFVSAADAGDYSERDLRARVMGRLREAMRPEFLNRIDEVVLFRKLEQSQLQSIVHILLGASRARLENQGIALEVDDAAVEWIARTGYEPEYGARPLRRVIQRELDDRIADLLVAGSVAAGGTVRVTVADDALAVRADAELPVAA